MKYRDTAQRRVIRDVFVRAERPLSVGEVHQLAQEVHTGLGIATVYRTIKRFLEEDWLRQRDIPESGSFFECTDIGPHHYFRCETCGKVYFTPCVPENVDAVTPEGFRVKRHDMFLHGTCRICLEGLETGGIY